MCIEFSSPHVGVKRNVLLSLTVLEIGDKLTHFFFTLKGQVLDFYDN